MSFKGSAIDFGKMSEAADQAYEEAKRNRMFGFNRDANTQTTGAGSLNSYIQNHGSMLNNLFSSGYLNDSDKEGFYNVLSKYKYDPNSAETAINNALQEYMKTRTTSHDAFMQRQQQRVANFETDVQNQMRRRFGLR